MLDDNSNVSTKSGQCYVPQAGLFYRVDSSRNTFAELWRDMRSPAVVLAWLSKLMRVKLQGSVNDLNVVSLRPFVVSDPEEDSLPADAMLMLSPIVRELTELGFSERLSFYVDDRFHSSKVAQVALLHSDGRTIARANHRVEEVQGRKVHGFTEFITELSGGNFLYSSSARAQLNVPPQCQLNWHPKAGASQLWVTHKQALNDTGQAASAMTHSGRDGMLDALERHHGVVRDCLLQRGVFSAMQGEDLAQVQALDRSVEQARGGPFEEPEVMAHLERLQQKRSSLGNGLFVLVVSIGLFLALGATAWDQPWHALLMIAGILLVHEAGHYVAMRVFKYRNVQMFFIPLLGAAVSGHNYTAPGWKKVIVALMGPLPGIVIGGILGIIGAIKGDDTLTTLAIMCVFLNGIQLLPLLPLDGGRVVHAILFVRHYSLEALFHGVAGVSLIGLGFILNDTIVWIIGLAMLMGLPATFKVARIARVLREQGVEVPPTCRPALPIGSITGASANEPFPLAQVAGQTEWRLQAESGAEPAARLSLTAEVTGETIPKPVVESIIHQVRTDFRQIKGPRQIALLTLRVYEKLATRPPGALASVGFGIVHGVALVASFFLIGVIVVARNPDWQTMIYANNLDPSGVVETSEIAEWGQLAGGVSLAPEDPSDLGGYASLRPAHQTVVATFATTEQAGQAFRNLKRDAPADIRAVQFGQTLLLAVPRGTAATKWFDEFENVAEEVFIDDGYESGGDFTLTCIASNSAQSKRIVEELSDFLGAESELRLIPPWVDDDLDARSDEERRRHDEARAALRRLSGVYAYDDPKLEELRGGLRRASRRADDVEYRRLSAEFTAAQNKVLVDKLNSMRDEFAPELHDFVDRFVALKVEEQEADELFGSDDEGDFNTWAKTRETLREKKREELGPFLGLWPSAPDNADPNPDAIRYNYHYGNAMEAFAGKLVVNLKFIDPSYGAPALVRWLERQGCRQFRYGFEASTLGVEWNE